MLYHLTTLITKNHYLNGEFQSQELWIQRTDILSESVLDKTVGMMSITPTKLGEQTNRYEPFDAHVLFELNATKKDVILVRTSPLWSTRGSALAVVLSWLCCWCCFPNGARA